MGDVAGVKGEGTSRLPRHILWRAYLYVFATNLIRGWIADFSPCLYVARKLGLQLTDRRFQWVGRYKYIIIDDYILPSLPRCHFSITQSHNGERELVHARRGGGP